MRVLCLITMIFASISVKAGDLVPVSMQPFLFSTVLLSQCALAHAQNLVEDVPLSDKWTFDMTNAQTICGILGFLGLGINYASAWYFQHRGQKKLLATLRQQQRDLQQRTLRSKRLSQEDNEPYQRLIRQCGKEPSMPETVLIMQEY